MAAAAVPSKPERVHYQYTDEQLRDFVSKVTKLRDQARAELRAKSDAPTKNDDKGRVLPETEQPASEPHQRPSLPLPAPTGVLSPVPATSQTSAVSLPGLSGSGIDPVLLTKSEVLVKAEIQQKRQRLEDILHDQNQQKKNTPKTYTFDTDTAPDYDVVDILKRAHCRIRPALVDEDRAGKAVASSTDSFDENTFYSSQMNESTSVEDVEEPKRRLPRRLCNYYVHDKPCPHGNNCAYSHDPLLKQRLDELDPQPAHEQIEAHAEDHADTRSKGPPASSMTADAAGPLPDAVATAKIASPEDDDIAQLERRLREMKEAKSKKKSPPRMDSLEPDSRPKDRIPTHEGLDEFGREISLRARDEDHAGPSDQVIRKTGNRSPQTTHRRRPESPGAANFPVYQSKLASPLAPQPARVSPLAVSKIPQISQYRAGTSDLRRRPQISDIEVISDGQSPNGSLPYAINPRKRRRNEDANENTRNVVQRRGPSPVVRIKQEPISPPPFQSAQSRRVFPLQQENRPPTYLSSADAHMYPNQGIVYQDRMPLEQDADVYEILERPRLAPPPQRAASRIGQIYPARGDSVLRRVVSERQMRAPASPNYHSVHVIHPDSEPRPNHLPSRVQSVDVEQDFSNHYRSSVQPQPVMYAEDRSISPPPLRAIRSPFDDNRVTMMAPPPRRVTVDQYGRRFLELEERSASMAPISRRSYAEPVYGALPSRSASVAEAQYLDSKAHDGTQIIRGPARPVSPQYTQYRRLQSSQPPAAEHPPQGYYDHRLIYEETRGPSQPDQTLRVQPGEIYRGPSHIPAKYEYAAPQEHVGRASSVQPRPRIVQLVERQPIPISPQYARHTSARPMPPSDRDISYHGNAQPTYQYEEFEKPPGYRSSRGYGGEVQDDGTIYEAPRQMRRPM